MHDCWLFPLIAPATSASGYPTLSLSRDPPNNEIGFHEILYYLLKGSTEIPDDKILGARCHRTFKVPSDPEKPSGFTDCFVRGKPIPERGVMSACINPTHYTPVSNAEERAICNRRIRQQCPHLPKCVWTGPVGQRQMCRDSWPPLKCPHGCEICLCANGCFLPTFLIPPSVDTELKIRGDITNLR